MCRGASDVLNVIVELTNSGEQWDSQIQRRAAVICSCDSEAGRRRGQQRVRLWFRNQSARSVKGRKRCRGRKDDVDEGWRWGADAAHDAVGPSAAL